MIPLLQDCYLFLVKVSMRNLITFMTSECLCLQIGGYVQQYKGRFTFASVRGAGHMVPSSQPVRGLALLDSFLKGMLPPYVPEQ